ncbi:MAG: HIT family protein, partial [Candidatus Vogelbacteria bacterium]|nr:HIT family protein [Candidatus Vogelbacteria bacterium]
FMMQDTLKKFRCPESLVKEYKNWLLLCRLKQKTLGSLVLLCKDEVDSFSKISDDSFGELSVIIREVEGNLKKELNYDKINYQMWMMSDPEVHFHIFPRFSTDKEMFGFVFKDASWPGTLGENDLNQIGDDIYLKLLSKLKDLFNK